jgi:glutamate/tyrosine decarboxylase-like PLP-dependent enzyme
LKVHGLVAFQEALDEKLDLAEYLAEKLPEIGDIEVVQRHPLHLPVVNFRLPGGDDANARLCELICAHGNVYLTTTRLPGHGLVVRACILHHRTDLAVVEQLLRDVEWAVTNVDRAVA